MDGGKCRTARSFLFLGVATPVPSGLFMRLSNFYARSLIWFHLYGGRSLRSTPFSSQMRIKRRCTLTYDSSRRDGEIQLSSGPRGITGISRPKASKMKSTRLGTERTLLAPYLGKVKREDRKRGKTFSREKFLTGGAKRKNVVEGQFPQECARG